MRRPAARVVFVLLIAAALLVAPAATLRASCCVAPAETTVAAPSCCGCDGAFSRPAPADRTAVESLRTPLAVSASHLSAGVDRRAWRDGVSPSVFAPVDIAPSSPFPRRL